ncbi:unnamed protein product [Cunninghamella blakesleeana]
MEYMRYIANHIRQWTRNGNKIDCWLFFVPGKTLVCERILEEEGVKGDITIGSFGMDWIPYEDDLISMELDTSTWKEIYLDGDTTSIYYSARALMKLQSIYGLFPKIIGKGEAARQLAELLLRMRSEQAVIDEVNVNSSSFKMPSLLNTVSNHIDQLIIVDRNIDVVTPLCTELTYEGLVDEVLSIRHGFVELDASLITPQQQAQQQPPSSPSPTNNLKNTTIPSTAGQPGKKKKQVLNSSDKLFSELRDRNFTVVGGMLNKLAKRINEDYAERHQAKTVAQIRDFVSRLGDLQQEHQSLRIHTSIAEQIMEYTLTDEFHKILEVQQNVVAGIDGNKELDCIEEMIDKQKPLIQVLRLLCLMSLAQGGLKVKVYEHFEKEIIQTYGYEHIGTLHRLNRLGLLLKRTTSAPSRSTFSQSRRAFKLIVEDVDEVNPNDISYVYSGYAPLSIRLVQTALQKLNSSNSNSLPSISAASNILTTTGAGTASLFSYVSGGASIYGNSSNTGSSSNNGNNNGVDIKQHGIFNGKSVLNGTTITNGWQGANEDALKVLSGKAFEIAQTVEYGTETNAALINAKKHGLQHPKTTVIFFLGGCTHTEVSAIRFLAQHDEGREYLVATTQLINGNSFLEPIIENSRRPTRDNIGVS